MSDFFGIFFTICFWNHHFDIHTFLASEYLKKTFKNILRIIIRQKYVFYDVAKSEPKWRKNVKIKNI